LNTSKPTTCHICVICQARSSYICPRCGINYCSLVCYKAPKHNQCSESFYRDCCMSAMRNRYVDAESKSRMMDILRREALIQSHDASTQPVDSDDSLTINFQHSTSGNTTA
ncbi:unnamed protein product, partial [Echinostoma caproni]|uniref:HIT-type domain-containing protein n=1 Tax=Echinostoma caproni TaxID=27848 RepID=A0A183A467_9TREM